MHEIAILGDHGGTGITGRRKDLPVEGIAQTKLTHRLDFKVKAL